ncbi:MAG: tetratricopeptide repeat protein [Pyrinomonadaceae bacterium]|nr:tetratricopeptide repeat protein [Pyrinomonadaceae bacterium]
MSENKSGFFQTNRQLIVYSALFVLVMAIYYQAIGFNFINLDDNLYIFNNPIVLSGLNKDSLNWAFTKFYAANWHPVTWVSHLIDVELYGANPGGHHATNIVFHLLNSILAFTVFKKMTGSFWKSAIVAALFAVHPAHVESVAWVSERKDVLSTMFWLLTMFVYLKYAESKNETTRERANAGTRSSEEFVNSEEIVSENAEGNENDNEKDDANRAAPPRRPLSASYFYLFLLSAVFALGLMTKPMLVTLPFVLLLMDFWALERLKTLRDLPALIIEKIPLFVLTAASSYITFIAQRTGGSVESLDFLPLGTRIVNAMLSYAKYTGMLFYPVKLGVWYPYDRDFPAWQIAVAVVFIIGMTALCLWQIRTRKYLLMGWLWFLGTLVPVIGLVQVGSQPLADRYTYVPYFGLFIMLVWGASDLFEYFRLNKNVFYGLSGAFVLVLTILAFNQTTYWRNNEILYKHTLSVTQKNFLISHNLCHHLTLEERMDEAEPFCVQSIADNPTYFEVYNTLGILKLKQKQYEESEKNFKECLKLEPNYASAYSNLAIAQIMQDKPEEAELNLQKAANLPNNIPPETFATVLSDLAARYAKKENYEKTAEHLNRLLYLTPNNVEERTKLVFAYFTLKRFDEAQKQVEELIRQNPNQAEVYNLKGTILLEKKQNAEAVTQFEKALQLKPDFAEAKANLEKAKGK